MATESTAQTPALSPNTLHPLPSDPPLYGDRRRVAFVSGAAQGIGLAIALRLARDGFDVAVNDINGAELESAVKAVESVDARSVGVVGDVGDEESAEKMIGHVLATLGYLDVMVGEPTSFSMIEILRWTLIYPI
jgi:meso-butanediol dehydrogenase / (S,S)-butanediol dehydrogenase / diacetyl reductase